MFMHRVVVFLASSFGLLRAQAIPEFLMNCTAWPDICDNTCNALYCHRVKDVLRYDANSTRTKPNNLTSVTSAQYRRNSIGCGSPNYCSKMNFTSPMDCDEYPYASTYDGGIGCISQQYTGVSHNGTTRCAASSQNRSHGATLGSFLRGLADGTLFRVVINNTSNITNSPICREVHPDGKNDLTKCPDDTSATSLYRYRDTPATSYCPNLTALIDFGDADGSNESWTPGHQALEGEEEGTGQSARAALWPLDVSGLAPSV